MQNMRRVPSCAMQRNGTSCQPPYSSPLPAREGCGAVQSRSLIDCLPAAPSLAMVYAPCQVFSDLYELDEALKNGTLFRALNMPFQPGYRKRGDCK